MKEKTRRFRFLVSFAVTVLLIFATENFCFAAREDIVLDKNYQLESEKNTSKGRLSWEIDFTRGLSGVSRLLGLGAKRFRDAPSREYLDALGMVNSKNDFLLTVGVNYLVTPKLELSAGVPVSAVTAEVKNTGARTTRGHSVLKFGAGDIYGDISYAILTESKYRPLAVATIDVNSALSEYTSMGDGFWGVTPGVYLRKFVCGPLYLTGLAGYTNRLERKGVSPGSIIRYGAGFGVLSDDKKVELNLERSHTAKTTIGNKTVMDSEEDLIMSVAVTTIFGSHTTTIGLFLAGLENGLNWGQNSAGIFMGVTF